MDQPPWTLKQQQSVATELERGDELLNNGNCDNLLETADINFNNSVNKCDRKLMENDLEAAISEKSKIKIQNILNEVNTLIPIEKLLLYLKLPSESANNVDPLRQPLNPLGSRTEITQTIMWIKTHLEEDPEISLQKKGVYDEYSAFCENKNIKPLSTADFGKVMKQVYPRVRPRRLGDMTSNINSNRHRETIRKIQQKYEGNQKRKMQMSQSKSEQKYRSKKAKLQQPIPTVASTDIKSTSVSPLMTVTVTSTTSICERKTSPPQGLKPVCDKSLDFTNLHTLPDFSSFQRPCGGSGDRAPEVAVTAAVTTTTSDQCSLTANTTPIGKVAIPRLTTKQQLHQQQQSPVLLQSPLRTAKNTKYKHIQPKPEQCDIATYNPQQSPSTSVGGAAEPRSQDINVGKSKRTIKKEEQNCAPSLDDDHTSELFTRERLISISNVDKDALDDYLGTNNSQENEELMSYFDQDNHEQDNPDQDTQESSKDKKLSQLRLLLEQNCPTIYPGVPETANVRSNTGNFVKITKHKQQDVISLIPTVQVNTTARRRVSFDTHTHDDIPPSPNTRRKNFSFTPISPGSHSPTGRQSKCSSTNASPFVSPRNTPIPRARGNSHPYPLNSSISVRKQFNLSKKSKHELELTIDHNNIKELCKNQVNLPMSAPPSPKTNLLQNLLNSGPKFNYAPNYCSQSGVQAIDQLSPEVSTLLSRNIQSNPEQSTHRSQSVPLNVDPVFNHASFTNQTAINEFNEIDTFPDTNHINVNKIIDTIGQTNLEPFLEQTKLISQNDYIDEAINIQIDAENFCQSENLPNLRERIQNLATDATDMAFLRCNPSRSVPSTPVPHLKANIDSIKQEINYSSRSYPSTPLANESFKYNQTQDYLLNGQPIKEKIASDVNVEMNFLGTMIEKNEMVFDATEVFNDANLNLIPSEHKTNFSFGQISDENNYGAKQNDPILNQESDIENDYFRNDINGT
ncbi:rfx transcription factor family [Holotrichia oblita]|uniref:Rfx transcription factor family n=2 Tax=Holotrichia oblita TaxID=644536 RepID=A0ACB9TM89_HOLOL|nr:rfx transcription factor family [Holotrichia oblita]KAI4467907.1 rfx transcription factor family [Holotrichia oblita]